MADQVLSYAFIGVWSKPIPAPKLDRKFCLDLFGPYSTQMGVDPVDGGFVIMKEEGPQPFTSFTISSMRFKIISRVLSDVVGTFARVLEVFPRDQALSAIGLNGEYEWEVGEVSPVWLGKRFVSLGLARGKGPSLVEMANLQFGLRFDGPPSRLYNIQLQPRSNNHMAIFANINDHREGERPLPDPGELERLLSESSQEILTDLKPFLIGGPGS